MDNTGPKASAATLGVLATGLLMALVVALAASVLGRRAERAGVFLRNYCPPSDYEAHIEYAMAYALDSSEANDIIFIGDSTGFSAVEPVAFEALTGLRAYNLSTVGVVGLDGFRLVLQRYLEHHPRPRLVVLCVHPWALGATVADTGPVEVRRHFLESYDPGAPREGRSPLDQWTARVRLGFWNTYGTATGGLQARLLEPIPRRDGESFTSLGRRMKETRGYYAQLGVLDPASRRPPEKEVPFPVNSEADSGLDAIAGLAGDKGVPLMVRLTPVLESGVTERFEPIRSRLAALRERHPGVLVSTPEVIQYGPADFGERLHLNQQGADRFTRFVAGEASRTLGGPSNSREVP